MLLDPNKLQDFVETQLTYKISGGSWVLTCPRCDKPKAYLRMADGRFICFTCERFSGKPEYLLAEILNVPVRKIQAKLYGRVYKPAAKWGHLPPELEYESAIAIAPAVAWPADYLPLDHVHSAKGRAYLDSRGISLETALAHGIRYSPPDRSVVFPVYDYRPWPEKMQGRLLGYQTRTTIPDAKIKAITMPGLAKAECLMFEQNLLGCAHAIVCEGPIDALKCNLTGGAVCTMGKLVSARQQQRIASHGVTRVYLALDTDAIPEMKRLSKSFRELGLEVLYMRVPAGRKDFGDCTPEEALAAFQAAKPVTPMTIWSGWG